MDKLWLEHYPPGVPDSIHPEAYSSLNDLFAKSFRAFPKRVSFISMGTALRFEVLEENAAHLASYLQKQQIPKGSRIAIMLPNLLQYPIALFGILRAGLVVVNTNPLYTADELVHQLQDAGVVGIVVLSQFTHVLRQALPQIPSLQHIIVTDLGDGLPFFKRQCMHLIMRYVINREPPARLAGAIKFRTAITEGSHYACQPVQCHADDLAFLQYTGGTSGVSKGAMLTHRNIIANILQAASWIAPEHFNANDKVMTALPLYHIFSLLANCLTFFYLGIPNVLIVDPRDTKKLLKTLCRTRPTALTGVNTLFASILHHPAFEPSCLAHTKIVLAGGMALNPVVADAWELKTGKSIVQAYGLTEASPGVSINLLTKEAPVGSIGLPLPSTEVSIRNAEGIECALGETGELCVRGPQVMQGYWQQPEETALVFWPDRFLRTGDSARMDEQGFIYLVDRIKDMIIISGFNVYPNEIEQVIAQMPQIQEVAVVGVPGASGNETIKACIVTRDPGLRAEEVIAHCKRHLTGYKIPKIVVFYPELPKTNVGKILRRMLK